MERALMACGGAHGLRAAVVGLALAVAGAFGALPASPMTAVPSAAGQAEDLDQLMCTVLLRVQGVPGKLDCHGNVFVANLVIEQNPSICQGAQLPAFSLHWWLYLTYALCCVVCAAMAAGMTLGFTSLEPFQMQVLCNCMEEDVEPTAPKSVRELLQRKLAKDQACAKKILPVISGRYFGPSKTGKYPMPKALNPSNEHYLLVTLLLTNAVANEALPIFLDQLVPTWAAVLLAVTILLMFGEIIPSAVFTGPKQLRLAALMCPTLRAVKVLLLPVVWPIALMLDWCLGHASTLHQSRSELKALVRTLGFDFLERNEANIIQGVLDMHSKTARDIAKPLGEAKMLPHDTVVDAKCVEVIQKWGHSRIFVYRRNPEQPADDSDIMGVLLVKKLLGLSSANGVTVGQLKHALKEPVVLDMGDNLLTVLRKFQEGHCHLGVVTSSKSLQGSLKEPIRIPLNARPTMFCSLENVIEEMLMEKIYDEEDIERGRHLKTNDVDMVVRWARAWSIVRTESQTAAGLGRSVSCPHLSDSGEDQASSASSSSALSSRLEERRPSDCMLPQPE